jgi:hypothetical protein
MKRIIILLAIAFFVSTSFESSAQPPWAKAHGKKDKEWKQGKKVKKVYYYYPASNVYYSPSNKQYWYPNNGSWVTANTLPAQYVVVNKPRHTVYYDGTEVWRDNGVHVVKFKKH